MESLYFFFDNFKVLLGIVYIKFYNCLFKNNQLLVGCIIFLGVFLVDIMNKLCV